MPSVCDIADVRSPEDADLVVSRGGVDQYCVRARDRSPFGRAKLLRAMTAEIQTSDKITLGSGDWDHYLVAYVLPQAATVAGRGLGITRLLSCQEDQRHSCGVEQRRGSTIQDLTVIWKPKDYMVRGGQALGYAADQYTGPPIVSKVLRCDVISYGSVAWYFWGAGKFHKFYAEDTNFSAGRIGVEIGMASASDCVDVTMKDCSITVDFKTFGGAGGDIGQRTIGLLVRGGSCTMQGGKIKVLGYEGSGLKGDVNCDPFEIAIGAATSSLGASLKPGDPLPVWGNNEWPLLNLIDVEVDVEVGGAKDGIGLWRQIGKLNNTRVNILNNPGLRLSDGGVTLVS